ncbi:ribosomal protein S18-alanine N-acetyltransferase [Pseudoalteromonas ostreae]|uniref:ribosomal protein S18-alanine N-acetyltransferase n=1 Tax=Pseudoalteromonas ostreae TaxID=2774154 RepID=UPI001B3838FA|nr:ribosomal protein S18-alanine N-acetyltransferase [Pseudoalteromonas ostreae]
MITFESVTELSIDALMRVENACHTHPWTVNTMQSCLAGRYFNLAAFSEQQIIGFYIGEKAGPDFTLMDICVAPDFQGRGIAKKLLAAFIEYGEKHHAENLFLEVRETNTRAIALYERAGFSEMSVRKNYYPSDDPSKNGHEDAILMGMTLLFG